MSEYKGTDFWWSVDPEERFRAVFAYVLSLDTSQSLVHSLNQENFKIYANRDPSGMGGAMSLGTVSTGAAQITITENCVASVVDTAVNLIAANRPKPTFLTDGAQWELQQHAKKLEKFTLGVYDKLKVYQTWVKAFRDACIFGTGVVKVVPSPSGLPTVERVIIDDIIVDETEARDCMPRQVHQRRWVDKGVLMALFPGEEHEKAIDASWTADRARGRMAVNHSNMVEVIESWHLPSGEGEGDGRHCICVRNGCLLDEDYAEDYFPFVFFRWTEPLLGFYGKGIVEDLTGLQMRLNGLNKFIRICQDRIARPDYFGDFDQRMPDKFFENGVGRFFRTKGGKPVVVYTPQALNAETYNERRYIVERMFALAGVAEMNAQAKKQPGITSGIAINAVSDLQTGRFAIPSENFEDAHLQTAERITWAMKKMQAGKKVKVVFAAKGFAETIDWSDVQPKGDEFRIDIAASSLLSRTPAGRLQQAMDMLQANAIDKDEWRELVDHPDVKRAMDLEGAARQYAEKAVSKTRAGQFIMPEPFENLVVSLKVQQQAYLLDRIDECPEDILELHLRRIDTIQQMLNNATQAAAPPPGAPMAAPMDPGAGAPMGMPGAPPQGMVPGAPLPPPGSPLPT